MYPFDENNYASWGGGDGVSYVIEHAMPSYYSIKEYWEPSMARYDVKEAAIIDDFIKEVQTALDLTASFHAFLDSLPPGVYHTGGITFHTVTEKKKTRRQQG